MNRGPDPWRAIGRAFFAVVAYVTPDGEPRSTGVVYKTIGDRLYMAVAPESWKARHIAASGKVSVTVLVPRGGLPSLFMPIPPATVSFHARAQVHPPGSREARAAVGSLKGLLPPERQDTAAIVEVIPEGDFLTYGIGVSLTDMIDPRKAGGRVPVLAR